MRLIAAAFVAVTAFITPCIVAQSQPAPRESQPSTPAYKLAPGPHTVRTRTFELSDAHRSKTLELLIRFPVPIAPSAPAELRPGAAAEEPVRTPAAHPLVIFSHGAGGSRDAFDQLSSHWANCGYIVIHPTHSDSVHLRRREGQPIRSREALFRAVRPLERHEDVLLILDSLDQLARQMRRAVGAAAPTIDENRIAIAGHSAGALTAQLAAGARIILDRPLRPGRPSGQSLADERIRAAIVISGQGTTNRLFTEDSWRQISIPMLVLAGSRDVASIGNETPESRRHPFEFARGGSNNKYLIYIEGATHGSYAGKATARLLGEDDVKDIDMITGVVAAGTTAFLDHHLRADPAAAAYLAGEGLVELGKGRVEYQRK
jgi:predicted dienelactone hydrolase